MSIKIVHIAKSDKGGAAIACIRLHLGLLELGIDSSLLTLRKSTSTIPAHYSYNELYFEKKRDRYTKKIKYHIVQRLQKLTDKKRARFLETVDKKNGPFSFIDSYAHIEELPLVQEADIINLHWVAGFINWHTFFHKLNHKKIVWTLHDMNPFTGGYHYSGGYEGYKDADIDVPVLRNALDSQLAHKNIRKKKKILDESHVDICVVSPSKWLQGCSEESMLFKNYRHEHIPYGLNTDVFNTLDKDFCRRVLNIPENINVGLFISQNVNVKRKGFDLLLKSMEMLSSQDEWILCSVGKWNADIKIQNVRHISLGAIYDERFIRLAYCAADVFITPTLEDNLPNVVLESLACGTPVIGFDIGGIPDMVKHGFNGLLSHEKSAEGLYNTITAYLRNPTLFDRQKIREDAVQRFDLNVQAANYLSLYKDLLA